jgi:hypothetical protein
MQPALVLVLLLLLLLLELSSPLLGKGEWRTVTHTAGGGHGENVIDAGTPQTIIILWSTATTLQTEVAIEGTPKIVIKQTLHTRDVWVCNTLDWRSLK